jgi:hypothetical protein
MTSGCCQEKTRELGIPARDDCVIRLIVIPYDMCPLSSFVLTRPLNLYSGG